MRKDRQAEKQTDRHGEAHSVFRSLSSANENAGGVNTLK